MRLVLQQPRRARCKARQARALDAAGVKYSPKGIEVDAHLRGPYNRQMLYRLRPELFVSVYVREDLWDAYLAEQSSGMPKPRM